ncbi:hypothetical protein U1Q18_016592 [Sarracenia purpurea var. burkii]
MEKDLDLVRSDIKQLKVETDQMMKAKGQICSQILEKQRRNTCLESDSSTISQTLELIQQERVGLSAKLVEKKAYYAMVMQDINARLQEQQIKDNSGEQTKEAEGYSRVESYLIAENVDDAVENLVTKLDSAKAKLDLVTETKAKVVVESSKVKRSVELVKSRISDFREELRSMNPKTLEVEHQALLSDRAGETEYLQSLQQQFDKLKGISYVVKCACGEEYKVEVDLPVWNDRACTPHS